MNSIAAPLKLLRTNSAVATDSSCQSVYAN